MISAYLISNHVYLVASEKAADPEPPFTLPIGSPRLTPDEARALASQILAAADKAKP